MLRCFGSTVRDTSVALGGRIAVALSGGVDSSVAAYLLKEKHFSGNPKRKILGIHMSNWDYNLEDNDSTLPNCWEEDWKDAKAVAQHLSIDVVHTSFQSDYWNSVFEPYVEQIAQRKTPNPDIDCNRYIKFGVLKEYLWSRYQIDTLATGHYARIWDPNSNVQNILPIDLEEALNRNPTLETLILNRPNATPILLAARDRSKDQSYFLSGVTGDAFRNVFFPLGDLLKKEASSTAQGTFANKDCQPKTGTVRQDLSVREIALKAKLPTAMKKESMGICFVGKRKHGAFLKDFLDDSSSSSRSDDFQGKCINVEDGSLVCTFDRRTSPSLLYATSGQGAKIGGASQKWFVVDKPDDETLLLCPGTHHPALYADAFVVENINWILGEEPPLPLIAQCRIRHLQPLVDCEIRKNKEESSSGRYEIVVKTPLRGIAPGQVCAIYLDDLVCLGCGTITKRGPTYLDLQKALPADLHPAGHNDLSTTAIS